MLLLSYYLFFFFFNDTATTEIYTLSLHDALPIYGQPTATSDVCGGDRLSARLPHTCLDPLSVPGGQGVVGAAGARQSQRCRVLAQQLWRQNWGGKIAGVMGLGRMGQTRPLAASDKAPVAVLPVRQLCGRLLPLDEGRLVAPVINAAHGVQVRFAPHERVHQVVPLPDRAGPVGIVRLGQYIRAEVALGVLSLLHHSHGAGEKLIEKCRVLQPQPCDHDDRHRNPPCPEPAQGAAGADDLTGFVSVSMPIATGRTRDRACQDTGSR